DPVSGVRALGHERPLLPRLRRAQDRRVVQARARPARQRMRPLGDGRARRPVQPPLPRLLPRGLMDAAARDRYGDELHRALRTRETVEPLTAREPAITLDDAYAISLRLLARRLDDGERVIGKKIGVTSPAVQDMLGVHQPDFGF